MIPGFGQALSDKYSILGQQANAATTGANAALIGAQGQANLANANAGQVAANAASQRQLRTAQGGLLGAQEYKTNQEGSEVKPLADSHIGLEAAETYKTNQEGNEVAPLAESHIGLEGHMGNYYENAGQNQLGQANYYNSSAAGLNSDLGGFHAGTADVMRPLTDQELHMIHQHLCMGGTIHAMGGMSQVPGQPTPASQVGTQASDQVPAMLAPDEAVLNKHAADIIGRDKIAAANAIGNHMATQERQNAPTAQAAPQGKPPAGKSAPGKGMIPPKGKAAPAPAMNHQKLAGGTHQVAHGKSAKTPTKIDPAAAMALLQMAKGGGGMPAPQPGGMPMPAGAPQGNPMPMPAGAPQGNPMPMQPAA